MPESTNCHFSKTNAHSVSALPSTRAQRRSGTVRVVAVIALVIAASDVLYQRVGTTAQADTIEYTPNLSGGFMAVGMTKQHPGFIVLSALDRNRVDVDALFYGNAIAGDSTVAVVRTGQSEWRMRLRGPMVVVVSAEDVVVSTSVDWSWQDFEMIRQGADCAASVRDGPHRCGSPFADFFDIVSQGKLTSVPWVVRRFLAPFARPGVTRTDRTDASDSR